MILITAKFRPKPEHVEDWPEIARSFTEATASEPGCLWFEWSRGVADPGEYVLIEAFRDAEAGASHVQSEHFRTACRELPRYLSETPKIINTTAEGETWAELGELAVTE